ncbi:MAG TPA: 4-vinyl reductase [Longimicrobiales bacterium]|nr:4-vinyl reductase [Longimicrobiales bacterium]
MRDALAASAGHEAAADALRSAGHAAGDAFFEILTAGEVTGDQPAEAFWKRFSQLFASRGWGTLRYSEVHPGVGALDATAWAEARADNTAEQPSCHFTTGMLANLLGRVAGADVAVLEVECRSRGDSRCRFLFGGTDAVFAVYERLATGEPADAALQQIG